MRVIAGVVVAEGRGRRRGVRGGVRLRGWCKDVPVKEVVMWWEAVDITMMGRCSVALRGMSSGKEMAEGLGESGGRRRVCGGGRCRGQLAETAVHVTGMEHQWVAWQEGGGGEAAGSGECW